VAQDMGAFSVDEVKGTLTYGERDNGFADGIVPKLKKKGLRDAVKTKETADTAKVEEYLSMGDLTEAEVDEFRKAKSRFYSLPRGKG